MLVLTAAVMFYAIKAVVGLRVSAAEEEAGLDLEELALAGLHLDLAGESIDLGRFRGVIYYTSADDGNRFVATIRQVEGEQRSRNPGASVVADSATANESTLNSPSPQRTPAES